MTSHLALQVTRDEQAICLPFVSTDKPEIAVRPCTLMSPKCQHCFPKMLCPRAQQVADDLIGRNDGKDVHSGVKYEENMLCNK